MTEQLLFLLFAALTLVAAVGVVVSRSVFLGALCLIGSFLGVAGLYVLLDAGFLAAIQVLVYVGAISVLILFAVMLTRNVMSEEHVQNAHWAIGLLVAFALFGSLAVLGHRANWQLNDAGTVPPSGGVVVEIDGRAPPSGSMVVADDAGGTQVVATSATTTLGRSFMTDYLLAFEVAGMLLLIALVGAVVVARE
jgi:NADH-quinone oxidoreductase subunit J